MARGVIHFEISSDNPESAVEFYRQVFDWQITKWQGPEDYWLVAPPEDKSGIGGAFMPRAEGQPPINLVIDVDDVDAYLRKVTAAGGKVIMEKTAIPGVGWYAAFVDPQGTSMGLMQSEETRT